MKKHLAALAAVAVAAAALAATASAATTVVSLARCALNGGTINVPAGNTVDLRYGWLTKNHGLTEDFLRGQTTTLAIDGVPVADADSYYGPITKVDGLGYRTLFDYVLGPITAPTTVSFTNTLAHPMPDLLTFDEDGTPHLFDGTVVDGSCTLVPV